MSDIDLLVSKTKAHQAQALLKELGFGALVSDKPDFNRHHMPIARRQIERVSVCVEIHHNLSRKQSPATDFETLHPRAIPFTLAGVPAHALGYEDMLAHTYHHMVGAPFQSFRLIWIADMVSLVERYTDQIDWERLPLRIYKALAVINWLMPFDGLLRIEKVLSPGSTIPSRKAAQLRGWPFSMIPAQSEAEYLNNIPKAFFPSAWWLRLYYGISPDHLLLGVRVWHKLHLIWWVIRFRGLPQITRHFKDYIRRPTLPGSKTQRNR